MWKNCFCRDIIPKTSEVAGLIKLVNVSKYYSTNNVIAMGLRKANLELAVNEFVAIVGESGSGKTTLLNVICGIDTYEEGEIYLNGEETSYFSTAEMENYRKKYVAFVFQNYNLIDSYTVLQNVEAPMILAGYPRKEIRRRALEIIDRVGLSKHIRHKATKLSGGQKQRVVIARALAKDCPIIAADEPTGNLDSESGKQILALLSEISKDKLVIIVTHDFDQVKQYATRKIRIYDGEIVEDVQLKPADKKPLPVILDAKVKIRFFDMIRMSVNNLFAVPRKTFLLTLVLFITTFFVAWMYGSYARSMAGGSEYTDFNTQFVNTGITRLVVRKADASIITPAELETLVGLNGTDFLVGHDYILDAILNVTMDFSGYPQYFNAGLISPEFVDDAEIVPYLGTVPDGLDEVALVLSANYIEEADQFLDSPLTLADAKVPMGGQTVYTIVGIYAAEDFYLTEMSVEMFLLFPEATTAGFEESLYFSQITETRFVGTNNFSGAVNSTTNMFNPEYYGASAVVIDDTVAADTIEITAYNYELMWTLCQENNTCTATGDLTFSDYYLTRELENITIDFDFSENNTIRMNRTLFERFYYDDLYQVSLFAESETKIDALRFNLSTFHSATFLFTYPFEQAGVSQLTDIIYFLYSYLTSTFALILVILATLLVTYLITRLVYNTKLRDYAIFRTIGANKAIIMRFIYIENILTTMASFVLFLPIAIYLNVSATEYYPLDGILYSFHYYTFGAFLVLFLILMLIALFNSRKYCRKIFKESVNKTLKTTE
jgi:putative ABC transport system permease protein